MAAEIPPMKPDILIMESTYGTHLHEKREEREARFTGTIHDIINRGGRCLIPVFALGRAQGKHNKFFSKNIISSEYQTLKYTFRTFVDIG